MSLVAILFLSPILNNGLMIEYFKCKGKIPVDMDIL
jgi:hypothetical protein